MDAFRWDDNTQQILGQHGCISANTTSDHISKEKRLHLPLIWSKTGRTAKLHHGGRSKTKKVLLHKECHKNALHINL